MSRVFPFYPILLGVFWVLSRYSTNQDILPGIEVTYFPLLVVTVSIVALMVVLRLVLGDWVKSSLITGSLFVISVSFGQLLPMDPAVYSSTVHLVLLPLWIVLGICDCILILKIFGDPGRRRLCTVGNVISICMLLVVISNIGIGSLGEDSIEASHLDLSGHSLVENPPDIYYIIPDEHASFSTLRTRYDYDASDFSTFLTNSGFKIVENAYTNYSSTSLSLSSSLNMRYLTKMDMSRKNLSRMVEDNEVTSILKYFGYQYQHLGSWFEDTSENRNADVNYNSGYGEFPWSLYSTTIFYSAGVILGGSDVGDYCRNGINGEIDYLLNGVDENREPGKPVFTFAHLLIPHDPIVFNADGSSPKKIVTGETSKEGYINQVKYIDSRLEEVIQAIQGRSEIPPIIIIQSDEGPNPEEWMRYQEDGASLVGMDQLYPEAVRTKLSGLFAVCIPGVGEGQIESLRSPVNIFRVIFNTILGANLELLPDQYYIHSDWNFSSDLVDVTDCMIG